jgi:hypothetical protein
MTEMAHAMTSRAHPPMNHDWADGEAADPRFLPRGCRGATDMANFKNMVGRNPQAISARVRENRNTQLLGPAADEGAAPSTKNYLVKECPFGTAKSCAYFVFGLAEVFDLMEAGKWHAAEAQVALLLCAGEHAALREWKWTHAWLLTHLPEPQWDVIGRRPQRDSVRPLSKLSAPEWSTAIISYSNDVKGMLDAEQRVHAQRPNPRVDPKATGAVKEPV